MLLAYVHLSEREPSLCLIADKIDTFSRPVPVDSLPITDCAVCRLGLYESVLAKQENDGSILITPMLPSMLYLTPNQINTPGLDVARIRIRATEAGGYRTEYQQDRDVAENKWNLWNPNTRQRM